VVLSHIRISGDPELEKALGIGTAVAKTGLETLWDKIRPLLGL